MVAAATASERMSWDSGFSSSGSSTWIVRRSRIPSRSDTESSGEISFLSSLMKR